MDISTGWCCGEKCEGSRPHEKTKSNNHNNYGNLRPARSVAISASFFVHAALSRVPLGLQSAGRSIVVCAFGLFPGRFLSRPLGTVGMVSVEDQTKIVNKAEATLRFMWNHHNVSLEHQCTFTTAGCTSLQVFKGLASSDEDLRMCLRADLGLEPTSMLARVAIANIVACWSAAWDRVEAESKVKAEARAAGSQQQATVPDMTAMADIYKQTVLLGEKLESRERPNRSYVGRKLQEIEEGEMETESLEEVTSKADGEEPDAMIESINGNGKRTMSRKAKRVPAPRDIPDLMLRHRVMAHCLGYIKTKHVSVGWIQTSTLALWEGFSRFLAGDKVYDIQVPKPEGGKGTVPKPEWSLILHYERELRKKANEWVQDEGLDIATALKRSMQDAELRALHFVTPYLASISYAANPPPPTVPPTKGDWDSRYQPYGKGAKGDWDSKGAKGDAKGKGKYGKKGDKGKKGQHGKLLFTTPSGARICFAFNRHGENCDASCGMEHVCRIGGCLKASCEAWRCPMASKDIKKKMGAP